VLHGGAGSCQALPEETSVDAGRLRAGVWVSGGSKHRVGLLQEVQGVRCPPRVPHGGHRQEEAEVLPAGALEDASTTEDATV
jgi:hypothetical protein